MEEDSPQSSVEAPDALASSSTGNGNSLQHQQNVADEPRRPGKRNGPFKRSKTGCSTCKSRGKKCDEAWGTSGKCERCLNGGLECHGRSEPVKRTRTAGPRPSISASTAASHPSPVAHPGSTYQPIASGSNRVSNTSSPSMSNLRSTQAPPPPPPPAHVLPPPVIPPHSYDTSTVVNPAYLMPTPSSGTHSTPHQQQSQFDWLKDGNNEPFAFLNTSFDGSYPVDPTQQAAGWNSNSFWDDFGSFLIPQTNTSPFNPTPNAGLESRLLFVPGGSSNPMRRGVSLAEIYARVVESWLVGLPSTARDYARARIMALNDTNSAMRAVRYAVAVAYIFLFTGGPQGTQNNALVELAYRGAGMEERTPGQHSTAAEDQNQGDAVKKLRSYVDQVSTPFAADSESSKWTQDAIKEIREVVVTDQNQLSDLLWGVIDLQLVEFIRGGAEPSYNMLALGDRLVRSVMASLQPSLTLSQLRTSETFSLRLYAFSDVSRCIVQRGRKTICRFIADHSDESVTTPAPGEEPWATYLGLPDSIIMLLADIVNLCADQPTENPYTVKSRADQIESALKEWKPTSLPSTAIIDSTALVSRTIAGQLWRLCAMVLLYQSVHRVGGLHPVLRHARSEILNLLDSVVRLPNGDLWGFIALPSFLAAGLSVSDSDRKRAMKHMTRVGPERVWLDNIALIEKLWEETDQTGKLTDWHDKMTREGMSVAFF